MYLLSGLSEDEAEKCVIRDTLQRLGAAGLQGLLSGGAAEVAGAMTRARWVKQLEDTKTGMDVVQNGQTQALLDAALSLPTDTKARNLAERILGDLTEAYTKGKHWLQTGVNNLQHAAGQLLDDLLSPRPQMQLAMAGGYPVDMSGGNYRMGETETGSGQWGSLRSAEVDESSNVTLAKIGELDDAIAQHADELTVGGNADIIPIAVKDYLGIKSIRNEKLKGQTHPVTGVPYVEKTYELDGKLCSSVTADFSYLDDEWLKPDQYLLSRERHVELCNQMLRKKIQDPNVRSGFTAEQLLDIEAGNTPRGYVWHHDVEPGHMMLVERDLHEKSGHTGGFRIWGPGSVK